MHVRDALAASSLSNFNGRLNGVIVGPLVFESSWPPGGQRDTSFIILRPELSMIVAKACDLK